MSENGAKPSVQALDAFAEWMRRVDERLQALDAAYGPFGTHNETHNHVNKRFDTLEAAWREFNASRAPRLEERVAELEAMHIMEAPAPNYPPNCAETADSPIVKALVKAARAIDETALSQALTAYEWKELVMDLRAALKPFDGDYV